MLRAAKLPGELHAGVRCCSCLIGVELDEPERKGSLLRAAFGSARIGGTELIAADPELVAALVGALAGDVIWPVTERRPNGKVPNGHYYLTFHGGCAELYVKDGHIIMPAGTRVSPGEGSDLRGTIRGLRARHVSPAGIVADDIEFENLSTASAFAYGSPCNGWERWHTNTGRPVAALLEQRSM
jgi:hypothetical protein